MDNLCDNEVSGVDEMNIFDTYQNIQLLKKDTFEEYAITPCRGCSITRDLLDGDLKKKETFLSDGDNKKKIYKKNNMEEYAITPCRGCSITRDLLDGDLKKKETFLSDGDNKKKIYKKNNVEEYGITQYGGCDVTRDLLINNVEKFTNDDKNCVICLDIWNNPLHALIYYVSAMSVIILFVLVIMYIMNNYVD
jgi:hypothetical protein